MNLLKLKVTRVDMDGYCGREHHPSKDDEGQIVLAIKMDTRYVNAETDSNVDEELLGDDDRLYAEGAEYIRTAIFGPDRTLHAILDTWRGLYVCYTCVRSDGALVELRDHEVELYLEKLECRICSAAVVCPRCANDTGDFDTATQR